MNSIRDFLRPAREYAEGLRFVDADFSNPQHARAVVTLLDEFAREPMGIGRPLTEDVKRRLVVGLRRHPATFTVLGLLHGKPVGVAVCLRGFSTFQARPVVNVHDLTVARSHRGSGIGRELLRQVERRARALRCSKITLEVREDNQRAQRLYESAGFEGTRSREGRPQTIFIEKVLPQRRPKSPPKALPAPPSQD